MGVPGGSHRGRSATSWTTRLHCESESGTPRTFLDGDGDGIPINRQAFPCWYAPAQGKGISGRAGAARILGPRQDIVDRALQSRCAGIRGRVGQVARILGSHPEGNLASSRKVLRWITAARTAWHRFGSLWKERVAWRLRRAPYVSHVLGTAFSAMEADGLTPAHYRKLAMRMVKQLRALVRGTSDGKHGHMVKWASKDVLKHRKVSRAETETALRRIRVHQRRVGAPKQHGRELEAKLYEDTKSFAEASEDMQAIWTLTDGPQDLLCGGNDVRSKSWPDRHADRILQ